MILRLILNVLYILVSGMIFSCQTQGNMQKNDFKKISDIEWAKPKSHSLTMDIYKPETGKKSYPVLMIFHGGGWMINTKSVMDSLSIYVVENAEFVVCNVNYRLLGDNENSTTMNEIVEDALGAFLWVKNNISKYGGDPKRVALTGDSAGGHLAMMVALAKTKLGETGFKPNKFVFKPSYIPDGKTIQSILREDDLSIMAVVVNYGVFNVYEYAKNGLENRLSEDRKGGVFGEGININDHPEYYKALSPFHLISKKEDYELPPMLITVGSIDRVTTPQSIKEFASVMAKNNQFYQYWEYSGRPHAFLDSHKNTFSGTVTEFSKDAPQAIDQMIKFLNNYID